jgi:hypothetical protein
VLRVINGDAGAELVCPFHKRHICAPQKIIVAKVAAGNYLRLSERGNSDVALGRITVG